MIVSDCAMSDSEFLQHLWNNDMDADPIIARLIGLVEEIAEYKRVFGHDIEEAIENFEILTAQVEEHESEMDDMQRSINQLEKRTVVDLIAELRDDIHAQHESMRRLQQEINTVKQDARNEAAKAALAKERLDMWGAIAE